jgi:type I restriction enzyme S subunit
VETKLGVVHLDIGRGVNPSRTPDKTFELYSVPSHEQGAPEIVKGHDIGSNKQTIELDTVLLCKINPRINRVWVTGNHSVNEKIASTEWIPFFPLTGLEPRYLAYFLRQDSLRDFLAGNASGVGGSLMRVRAATFRDFSFYLAPLSEQTRIVDALEELFSDLDAGVEALRRVQEKLKLYRASVLKAAVEGELTAEWRAQHPKIEPASELLKRILAERRRRWEEEQLRKFKEKGQDPPNNWKAKYKEPVAPDIANLPPLPEGWCWSSFGRCFEVHVGATPSRVAMDYWNGSIPWVTSGEVQFCRIAATREKITKKGLADSSTKLNPVGSVILNMIGEGRTRGKAGILEIAACNNQNCAAIWVSMTPIEPAFVYLWLLYRYEQTRELGSGNNQPAMNKSIVKGIPFPLPPLGEMDAIIEAVEDQLSVIDHLEADIEAKLKNAQALRQAILRQAFTGQLVPQDPNDEPAAELLKRIVAEREQRTRDAAAAKRTTRTAKRVRTEGRWPRCPADGHRKKKQQKGN